MEKQYLRIRDVTKLTGFSASKVGRLIRDGRLPAKNSSPNEERPRYVIRAVDLERFLTPESRMAEHAQ